MLSLGIVPQMGAVSSSSATTLKNYKISLLSRTQIIVRKTELKEV